MTPDKIKSELANYGTALEKCEAAIGDWSQWPSRMRRNAEMTFAVLQGAVSAEIESAGHRDNPYSAGSLWRWAWWTGFDLGRRIDKLLRELRDALAENERLREERDAATKLREEWSLAFIAWTNTDGGRLARKATALMIEADIKRIAAERERDQLRQRVAELEAGTITKCNRTAAEAWREAGPKAVDDMLSDESKGGG